MRFLSLFAGIGGIDLGLERAGMTCVAQVEIDSFCRRVLARHWPDVPKFDDVRTVNRETLRHLFPIDLIAGGFPCQDISNAGKRAGIGGERSGLWSEFHRLIGELRPKYVLVENVAALLDRGICRVLGDLASRGFDAEWDCLPACAFGAPYERDRMFILARSAEHGRRTGRPWRPLGDAPGIQQSARRQEADAPPGGGWWATEPGLVRLVHGLPPAMERIRGLGNVVVPQAAEWIGRRIMEAA